MKKRALKKDFRVELKKTYMRFLSILLIVALGVAFFSGLRACKTDMLESTDAYYDEVNFMDLYLAASYGITDEDLLKLAEVEGVKEVEGAYTKDVLVQLADQNIVVKSYSNNDTINRFHLVDGREPENNQECMVDTLFLTNTGYQVGDTIQLSLDGANLSESLQEVSLTIVGSCQDARYLSIFRGNGDIGNGTVNSFIVLNKENYLQDVYSEAYITVEGASTLDCYEDEYEQLIDEIQAKVEAIADVQCEQRYEALTKEPKQQLSDAKDALNLSKEQLKEEKDTAYSKLNASKEQLEQLETGIATLQQSIEDKKTKLEAIHYGEEDINRVLAPFLTELENQKLTYEESYTTIQELEQNLNKKFSQADTTIADAQNEITSQETKLTEIKTPEWYVGTRNWVDSYVSYISDADRIDAIAKIFPVIFFFVAALVCLTTMTRMVDEQRTQIGILKALGYGKLSIAGKFMKYCFFATISGSVVGALIGQKIFPYVVIDAYRIMYAGLPKILTNYQPRFAVMAGALAIGCTMIATYAACMKDLMSEPAELMRPVAPKAGKRILLERMSFIWKHLNFTKKSTLRNLFRYKKRFLMTTIGIAGCMGLIIVGFGIKDSIGVMAELQYKDLWLQDGEIVLEDHLTVDDKNVFLDKLIAENEITTAQLLYKKSVDGSFQDQKKSISLYVMKDVQSFDEFFLFRNRVTKDIFKVSNEGVIVTEKYASMLGVKAGDNLTLDFGNYQPITVTVEAISENYLGHYVFMSESLYEKLMGSKPEYNGCLIEVKSQDEAIEKELFTHILSDYEEVMSISSTRGLNNRIHSMLDSLNIITYVLIVSAGLLAFVVLYNLSNININERKRELASLKVLGFYDGEVNAYVMRENIILTLIGIALGVLLGKVLHRFVIATCEIDAVMFGRLIKGISYGYSAALTLLFSLIICFFTYFKLKKVDMIESLKSVE